MTWQEEFKKKTISADEAANFVKSGDCVVISAREPHNLCLALAARVGELKDIEIYGVAGGFDVGWYDAGWEGSFKIALNMPTAVSQAAFEEKRTDLIVGPLIPFSMAPANRDMDVFLVEISTPDENGFCSFGNSAWDKKKRINEAKLAIGEMNSHFIRPCGSAAYVHISELDYVVEHQSAGGTPGKGSLTGRALKPDEPYLQPIMENVRSLIKDGDTIQIGVGRTTERLVKLGLLEGKNDLGLHTEATMPGVIKAVRDGVINGKYKTINRDKAVVTTVGGDTREEMNWVNQNPLFEMVDVFYLEDIRVIAAHDNMVCINNILGIDFTGQIGSETIGTRLIGPAGGQPPFAIAAQLSKGGRSISIMPSTVGNGKTSRIMPFLPQGTVVTIPRTCTDYVVTEYGIAELRGRTARQRAERLIAIAHPDHRDDLMKEARKQFWP
ncbi:acetyl-CoA hydrolase/transferase family protein [Chloroflexota bacterium]